MPQVASDNELSTVVVYVIFVVLTSVSYRFWFSKELVARQVKGLIRDVIASADKSK